jgi:hypothetical protein
MRLAAEAAAYGLAGIVISARAFSATKPCTRASEVGQRKRDGGVIEATADDGRLFLEHLKRIPSRTGAAQCAARVYLL